jgi:hypothetical protein
VAVRQRLHDAYLTLHLRAHLLLLDRFLVQDLDRDLLPIIRHRKLHLAERTFSKRLSEHTVSRGVAVAQVCERV